MPCAVQETTAKGVKGKAPTVRKLSGYEKKQERKRKDREAKAAVRSAGNVPLQKGEPPDAKEPAKTTRGEQTPSQKAGLSGLRQKEAQIQAAKHDRAAAQMKYRRQRVLGGPGRYTVKCLEATDDSPQRTIHELRADARQVGDMTVQVRSELDRLRALNSVTKEFADDIQQFEKQLSDCEDFTQMLSTRVQDQQAEMLEPASDEDVSSDDDETMLDLVSDDSDSDSGGGFTESRDGTGEEDEAGNSDDKSDRVQLQGITDWAQEISKVRLTVAGYVRLAGGTQP